MRTSRLRGVGGGGGGGVIACTARLVACQQTSCSRVESHPCVARSHHVPFLRRKPSLGGGWGRVGVIAHTARLAVCQQTSYPRYLPAPEARYKYTHMHAVSLPNESMCRRQCGRITAWCCKAHHQTNRFARAFQCVFIVEENPRFVLGSFNQRAWPSGDAQRIAEL